MDTTARPIRDLDTLLAELDAAAGPGDYGPALERIEFGTEALERFLHFDPAFYTRNLVRRTPAYELIALCWEPGQATPIHDHDGSDGWVVGMSGRLEEVRYHERGTAGAGSAAAAGAVTGASATPAFDRVGRVEVPPGAVAHIHDDIALHEIRNDGAERAVSLHLYAPPIDECRGFDAKAGCWVKRRMRYHTVEGEASERANG